MNLVDHLELHLGPIQRGFPGGGLQVAEFRDGPVAGSSTFVTLGMSHHELSVHDDQTVRQELLIACREPVPKANVASVLLDLGEQAITEHSAYLRGDVIGPRGPMFPSGELCAVYIADPVSFPEAFARFEGISLIWAVPITVAEAHFVGEQGWRAFEQLLVDGDPDLLDLERPSVVE